MKRSIRDLEQIIIGLQQLYLLHVELDINEVRKLSWQLRVVLLTEIRPLSPIKSETYEQFEKMSSPLGNNSSSDDILRSVCKSEIALAKATKKDIIQYYKDVDDVLFKLKHRKILDFISVKGASFTTLFLLIFSIGIPLVFDQISLEELKYSEYSSFVIGLLTFVIAYSLYDKFSLRQTLITNQLQSVQKLSEKLLSTRIFITETSNTRSIEGAPSILGMYWIIGKKITPYWVTDRLFNNFEKFDDKRPDAEGTISKVKVSAYIKTKINELYELHKDPWMPNNIRQKLQQLYTDSYIEDDGSDDPVFPEFYKYIYDSTDGIKKIGRSTIIENMSGTSLWIGEHKISYVSDFLGIFDELYKEVVQWKLKNKIDPDL